MKKFDYYQPETLGKAYGLMEKHAGSARYIAGGTDLIIRIKHGDVQPEALISLKGIEALKGIRANDGLSLGSMTRIRTLVRSPEIARDYPALGKAASVLATPQIRNVATLGGNFCNASPCADCVPPLMVMGAELVIEGPGGTREISIERFFKGPGITSMHPTDILKEIIIPVGEKPTGSAFFKTGRVAQDLALVSAAALVTMNGKRCRRCRLAVGSVAPVPLRLKRIEKLVEGRQITPDLLDAVADGVQQDVSPITDVRSTREYRRTVSGVLVKRAIIKAVENSGH